MLSGVHRLSQDHASSINHVPGSRPHRLQRTTSPHMKDPRMMLERQAEVIAHDATMTNLKYGSQICSPIEE